MLRRILRRSAPLTLLVTATSVSLFGGCGGLDVVVADLDDSPVVAFDTPDASEAATPPEELVSYCASSQCPAGHETCPDSIFPCDVDLKSDPRNCGACGAACPREGGNEFFSCVDGQCVMTCKGYAHDCDGLIETGCEVFTEWDNDNCGGCGTKCGPDDICLYSRCGCPSGQMFCWHLGMCIRPQDDDENCGACENACDPAGDGSVRPPHMYFGCQSGACGELKCEPGWADCDGNKENGCEKQVATDTDCATCDDNCSAKGQTCLRTPFPDLTPYCGCPEGQTFCGSCTPGSISVGGDDGGVTVSLPPICIGQCFDLTNDVLNCGACGLECKDGTCEYGSCVKHCPHGRADCDGNPDCEVNTLSDPANCGGCGIACNAVEGQACVGGKCVVEPCDAGTGGTAR